jgi:hypothetical protein
MPSSNSSHLEHSTLETKTVTIMNKHIYRYSARFVFLLLLVAIALSQDSPSAHGNRDAWPALTSSMENMHAAMASVKPSGDGDVDFATLMLPHHHAAIEMAKSELLHGKDPQMRRLAQEIITDQQSEIELMQLWLKQHPPTKNADSHPQEGVSKSK